MIGSLQQHAQRLDGLPWMISASQLIDRQPSELVAKNAPARLLRRVALISGDAP